MTEFAQEHPECGPSLDRWYRIVKHSTLVSFAEVRRIFPSADRVGELTVFNIGGDKAKLVAAIHYNRRTIYIRHVLTHAEYNRNTWRE